VKLLRDPGRVDVSAQQLLLQYRIEGPTLLFGFVVV